MSKTPEQFRDEIIQKIAEGFRIQGMELIDAQTDEPVIKLSMSKNPIYKYTEVEAADLAKLSAFLFGQSETYQNDDGSFDHIFTASKNNAD